MNRTCVVYPKVPDAIGKMPIKWEWRFQTQELYDEFAVAFKNHAYAQILKRLGGDANAANIAFEQLKELVHFTVVPN